MNAMTPRERGEDRGDYIKYLIMDLMESIL